MSKNSDQIKLLENQIYHHRKAYYNKEAEISDASFDVLIDELIKLDPENKAITSIGTPAEDNGWKKVKHGFTMGSLNKASNLDELNNWINKYVDDKSEVFIIDKIDGLSINLQYQDGKLVSAISRGDGEVGDNIYKNVIKMKGVKTELPLLFTGNIRGEIVLKKADLEKYFPDQLNGRNISAGLSRRLDGVGCEHLSILTYYVSGNADLATEEEVMLYLNKDLGLEIPNWSCWKKDKYKENIKDYIQHTYLDYQEETRKELPYEIDGLVIRLNNLQDQQDYGEHNQRQKAAIALKFPASNATSIIRQIDIQLGNSGRITPVGVFDPVILDGAEITKASLHNFTRIKELGIDIGAEVLITRRGGIIPQIEIVLKNTGKIFPTPKECPVCKGPVNYQGEYLVCSSSDNCPGQIKGKIATWINTLGILEWGDKLIDRLVDEKLVKDISDLYKLSIDDIAKLDRMGKKSAETAYEILWSHNKISLDKLLGGLNIQNCASSTIQMLIQSGHNSLNKIFELTQDQLSKINGIGPIKAEFIYNGLKNNKKIIEDILKSGIKIQEQNNNGKLVNKSFVITGKTEIKRDDLKKIIEENGGVFKSSVSNGVNYLVSADPMSGSVKMQKAEKMGVKLISEHQLLEMVK